MMGTGQQLYTQVKTWHAQTLNTLFCVHSKCTHTVPREQKETMHAMLGFTGLTALWLCLQLTSARDFYSHNSVDMDGNVVPLEMYRGKVTLVVNVASECGFTDRHYKQMVKAQDIFGKTNRFNILAYPCNQFGGQEPKSNQEILKFAKSKYGVNFRIFSKVNVKTENVPDVWTYLTEQTKIVPDWNFYKYLVDHDGKVLGAWGPRSDLEEIWDEVRKAVDTAVVADKPGSPARASPPETSGTSRSTSGSSGPKPPTGKPRPNVVEAPATPKSPKRTPGSEGAKPPIPAPGPEGAKPPVARPPVHEDL